MRIKIYKHNDFFYCLPAFLLDPDSSALDLYIKKLQQDPEFATVIGLLFAEHFAIRRDNGFASLYDYLVNGKDLSHIYNSIRF